MLRNLSDALAIAVRSDPGIVRSHNEDAVFADPQRGLAILADGMGGYKAGEVASGMATALLSSEEPAADGAGDTPPQVRRSILERIAQANAAIYRTAAGQPQYAGMGTTLVMARFHDNRVSVAHIGDSRLYRLRGEAFAPLTRDHSLLQEQLDSGLISAAEARHSLNRNLVTRALGVAPEVAAEIHDYPVQSGDLYLLCSDGLNDMLDDEEIGTTLRRLGADLDRAATQLVRMANDKGGRDNVSVILIKVLRGFPAPRGAWEKLAAWFR